MKQVGRQILLGGLGAGRLAISRNKLATEMLRFETSRLAFAGTNPKVRSTSLIRPARCCIPCRRWVKTGNDRRRLPCPVYPLEADVRRANRHPLRAAHRSSADQLTHLAVAGWQRDQSTLSRRSSVAIEDKNQDALDLHSFARLARADNDDLGRAHRKKSTSRRS